jgi:hypothetical protein
MLKSLRVAFQYLARARKSDAEPQPLPGDEWATLMDAVRRKDFNAISPALRAWCITGHADLANLSLHAVEAGFDSVQIEKLGILFHYYANNVALAFQLAQVFMTRQGPDFDLHVVCLVCLYQNNQFEDALVFLDQVPTAQTHSIARADYWQMVAVIRWAMNDMPRLKEAADRSVALAPQDPAVLQTALGMYVELGELDQVHELLSVLDAMPEAHGYAYSLSLLALTEFERGWVMMEARYDMTESDRYINKGLKPFPRWKGAPLENKRLLVTAEQGLGDTIQMARYLTMLQQQAATCLQVETQPETLTLLQHNFPGMTFVERAWAKAPNLPFDLWVGMMSLPLMLKAWGPNVPGKAGYLTVPPDARDYWAPRVHELCPGAGFKVGLAWSGQPAHRADRRRSVPFELMMRYAESVNATFFALQTKVPDTLPANVINVSEEMLTLADTLALIEQMDLVITVDTSVVHLAGSIGKETWLLLPKRYEWRWGLEGEGNDWYDSVRVLRQETHACWEPVLERVFQQMLPQRLAKQE